MGPCVMLMRRFTSSKEPDTTGALLDSSGCVSSAGHSAAFDQRLRARGPVRRQSQKASWACAVPGAADSAINAAITPTTASAATSGTGHRYFFVLFIIVAKSPYEIDFAFSWLPTEGEYPRTVTLMSVRALRYWASWVSSMPSAP